jgi:chemotaxis protein MotB
VRRTPNWLEIEIRTDILFPSGVATLSPSANSVLTNLGDILAPFANPLRVEGYTDDVPIDTNTYPSNWELSAARAASVARLFSQHGVDPERLGIVGWGQYRPAADNESEDGRNKNRRVLVVVLSDKAGPRRFYTNSDAINTTADTETDSSDDETAATSTPAASSTAAAPIVTAAAISAPPATPAGTIPAPKIIVPVATIVTPPVIDTSPHLAAPDSKG